MTTDNEYSEVLLKLKTKYEQALAKLETDASQIKTRLASLDTLIDDPLLGSDLLSVLQGDLDSVSAAAPTSKVAQSPKPEAQPKKAASKASVSTAKKPTSTSKKPPSQAKTQKNSQKKAGRSSSTTLPMKKPYDQMTKIDAIQKIMQGNPGKVMHTDDLIKELFGKLSPEQHKAERGRMKTAMYTGCKDERWIKVPKKQMCYVYESYLGAKSEQATTTKPQKSRKKTN